jgi:hypothetical protein
VIVRDELCAGTLLISWAAVVESSTRASTDANVIFLRVSMVATPRSNAITFRCLSITRESHQKPLMTLITLVGKRF